MKFTILAKGYGSDTYPKIALYENNKHVGSSVVKDFCEINFDIALDENFNCLVIDYYNKLENQTKVVNGEIVEDQYIEFVGIRLNDILLNSWALTESDYYPRYFHGFLTQYPNSPTKIRSQLICHFPGKIELQPFPNKNTFWEWYYQQRRYVYVEQLSDQDRVHNELYAGSTELLNDLINEIKTIINV
jgi:hypothetical protein